MKPILFNTEMVRAILEGRKTVTRRVIKPPRGADDIFGHMNQVRQPCVIGDILYVRERFCIGKISYGEEPDGRAVPYVSQCIGDRDFIPYEYCLRHDIGIEDVKWKPSIHMPKEAARIFLKVTDVRVERLQEITNEGCIAEGTDLDEWYEYDEWQHQVGDGCVADGIPVVFETLRGFFGSRIWNSTLKNKDEYYRYGWDANPWVWVIEFARMQKAEINE